MSDDAAAGRHDVPTSESDVSKVDVGEKRLPRGKSAKPASIPWMAQLGLEDGDWFHASKPALRRGMAIGELKSRVFCCGVLASQAYQGEGAMTMRNNERVPLSAAGMAKQLYDAAVEFYVGAGIELTEGEKKAEKAAVSRSSIRRVLAALEQEGSAERRTADGRPLRTLSPRELKRLPNGDVRMFFFVRPRPAQGVKPPAEVGTKCLPRFETLSAKENQLFQRLLARLGLSLPLEVGNNGYLAAEVKVGISDYLKDDEVAVQKFKKRLEEGAERERIVITPVIKSAPAKTAAADDPAPVADAAPAAAEERFRSKVQTPEDPGIAALTESLRSYDPLAGADSAKRLLDRCRKKAPKAEPPVSAAEVISVCEAMVDRKGGRRGDAWRGIDNPIGFFIDGAPDAFPAVLETLRAAKSNGRT
jgi:hypothetical protein